MVGCRDNDRGQVIRRARLVVVRSLFLRSVSSCTISSNLFSNVLLRTATTPIETHIYKNLSFSIPKLAKLLPDWIKGHFSLWSQP